MPTDTWDNFQRWVCKQFKGRKKWRGDAGADCHDTYPFSVEAKYGKQVPKKLETYMLQAEGDALEDEIPIVVMKRYGMADDEAYIMLRLSVFLDWYV